MECTQTFIPRPTRKAEQSYTRRRDYLGLAHSRKVRLAEETKCRHDDLGLARRKQVHEAEPKQPTVRRHGPV